MLSPLSSTSFRILSRVIQFENALRRHNHLGTIHALLLALAQANLLDGAVDRAKTKMQERIRIAQEKRAKGEIDDED